MVDIVTMRKASTLPGQNVNVTMRKASTLPGQNVMEQRHTDLLVALGVLTYLLVGDGRLLHSPVVLPVGAQQPLSAAALVGLALGAYLLDTLPLVAIGALRRRAAPWRAWHELYGRTLCAEVAVPGLGILGALTCAVAWPAVL